MNPQRSSLAKWALFRRFEAHVMLPGMISLVLIALYFFSPEAIQRMVAPGAFDVPFSSGRKLGVVHLVMGIWLLWSLVLGVSILSMARDASVWLMTVFLMTSIVFSLLMWLDGHSLTSRATDLWLLGAGEKGAIATVLSEQRGLLDLTVISGCTLLFFVLVPLVYGGRGQAMTHMLIPSRWLISTSLVMVASFWLAFSLHGQGWDQVMGETGALQGDLSVFIMPTFLYMVTLYLARIQYRTWVRREAEDWQGLRRQ
jgi:hypothetical protein